MNSDQSDPWQHLEKSLTDLADLVEAEFSKANLDDQIKDIRVLIWAGEYQVAWEQLWSNLREYRLPISTEAYRILNQTSDIMHLNTNLCEEVKEQIIT